MNAKIGVRQRDRKAGKSSEPPPAFFDEFFHQAGAAVGVTGKN